MTAFSFPQFLKYGPGALALLLALASACSSNEDCALTATCASPDASKPKTPGPGTSETIDAGKPEGPGPVVIVPPLGPSSTDAQDSGVLPDAVDAGADAPPDSGPLCDGAPCLCVEAMCEASGQVCGDTGSCVECVADADCGAGFCSNNACAPCDPADNRGCDGSKAVCQTGDAAGENSCVACTTKIDCNGAPLPTLEASPPGLFKLRPSAPAVLRIPVKTTGLEEGTVDVVLNGVPAGVGFTTEPAAVTTLGETVTVGVQLQSTRTAAHGGPLSLSIQLRSSLDPGIETTLTAPFYVAGEPGALDRSFGSAGTVDFQPLSKAQLGTQTLVYPSGRMIMAGAATDEAGNTAWITALNPDGLTDTSFGAAGYIEFPLDWSVSGMVPRGEGVLIFVQTNGGPSLVRALTRDGNPDPGFGAGGDLTLGVDANADGFLKHGEDVVWVDKTQVTRIGPSGELGAQYSINAGSAFDLDERGRLWVGSKAGTEFFIDRVTETGVPDAFFGNNGRVAADWFGVIPREVRALLHDRNGGKLAVLTGLVGPGHPGLQIIRVQEDGALEESFGLDGDIQRSSATFGGLVVRPSGAFVLGRFRRASALRTRPASCDVEFFTPDGQEDARVDAKDANTSLPCDAPASRRPGDPDGSIRLLHYDSVADRLILTNAVERVSVARIWL